MTYEIIVGDARRELRKLEADSFDACLCDPPYGLSFMGHKWDYRVPSVNVWVELLRVLKPGAFAMMFGGSRTFHRMVVNIEDSGFVPCDLLLWMYSSGYPKSLDIAKALDKKQGHWRGRAGKALEDAQGRSFGVNYERSEKGDPVTPMGKRWDGYGTALKPAYEPILLCWKPTSRTFAETVVEYGTGALNLGASRIGDEVRFNPSSNGGKGFVHGVTPGAPGSTVKGYFPSNVSMDEVVAQMLDAQVGENASRFFFCSKANRKERDRGLEGTTPVAKGVGALRDGGRSASKVLNDHSTVKPLKTIRYFARMLLPPPREDKNPRRLIVPFSGSGSEMIGALQVGWDEVVGIELDPKHADKARLRIARGRIVQHS